MSCIAHQMLLLGKPKEERSDLNSSVMLRSVSWQLASDVSGQPVGPIFMGQAVQFHFVGLIDP
jgi:hypothetical protein